MPKTTRFLASALVVLGLCLTASTSLAVVAGTPHSRLASYRVFGNQVVTGNTLMSNTPSQPLVNSILLDQSTARIAGIPTGATIEGAYLFWSGSTNGNPDRNARLELPDGFESSIRAQTCFTSPVFGGFFYCRAEITDLVSNHGGNNNNFNGLYTVSDVDARPGLLDENGQCIDANCQARYAGWSVAFIYSHPDEATQRDIVLYDGFRQLDEDARSAGIDTFVIDGFDVPNPPIGTFTFFALEGDALLGIPPQNLDPNPQLRCNDCDDYIEINGQRLQDPNNPPANLFNSTTPSGGSLGVDIDTFDVSDLFRTGDTTARVEVGSGDGRPSAQGGGGESFFLGYVTLSLNRLAPNFRTRNTLKTVDPDEAGPGETVFFEIEVTNDGSLAATNVVVTDVLNANFQYVPNSTRVDGVGVADVNGQSPLQRGLRLGTITETGDNDRRVSFRAVVREGVASGTRIPNVATIDSAQTEPNNTNQVIVTVVAPALGTPTKSARDVNGGEVEPGDSIEYTIFIPNNSGRTASGVRFTDDMPDFVQLVSVAPTSFNDRSDPAGGINGRGRVEVDDILIPGSLQGVFLSYTVQIDTAQELVDQGIDPADIDGFAIANQGRVSAAFLQADLLTDNPATQPSPDPTIIRLSSAINFTNPQTFKRVSDVNGGNLVPGDTLEYTLELFNAGNMAADARIADDMPAFIEGFSFTEQPPGVSFVPAPAGANGTGRLQYNGTVGGSETVRIVFTVDVADSAPGGAVIQNIASLVVPAAPDQNRELATARLTVTAGPDLSQTTKEIVDAPPGGFQPGDDVTYRIVLTNTGNRAAAQTVVRDGIALNLTNVRPANGGVFDQGQRRITWDIGNLPPQASRELGFTATIVSPLPNGTVIRNQALVSASNVNGQVGSDDPSTVAPDDATVLVVQSTPNLTLSTKTVADLNGDLFEPDDVVRYTIEVVNDGRDTARNVRVTDPLDANLTLVSSNPDGGSGPVLSWNLPDIAPGESATVTLDARINLGVAGGTDVGNQAQVSATGIEDTLTDNPATPDEDDPTVFQVTAMPSLVASLKEVVDDNGGSVQPGDLLTYTITVQNDGNGPASGVVITDPVDANLTNIAPADGGVLDAGVITWPLAGPVAPGGTATVQFRALVADGTLNGTIVSNQATIRSPDVVGDVVTDDPRNGVGDDNSTDVTVESRPDFVNTSKFVRNESRPQGFQPGDEVVYIITVRNSGTQQGTNVVVTDTIPAELDNIRPENGGALTGRTVTWTLPSLAAAAEAELLVRAQIRNPLADGTPVANQAFVASDEVPEPVPSDDPNTEELDDTTAFVVTSIPVLTASRKSFTDADGEPARPGDTIEWTLEIINTGTSPATDVVVTDVVPAELTDIVALDGGEFNVNNRTMTWNAQNTPALASVAADPDQPVTLRFRSAVSFPLDNGTIVSNQATINAAGLETPAVTDDPRTVDIGDPTTFPVISAADFTGATKQVEPQQDDQYNPGDTVRYQVRFTNDGDAAATNVVVTDVIDENLTFAAATDGGRFAAPTLTWNATTTPALARVEAGQSVTLAFDALVRSPLDDGTEVFNQARISADGFVNALVTDDPSTPEIDDPTLFRVTAAPSLDASTKDVRELDGNGFFEPGDTVEYVITVRNDGTEAARNVVVTDTVDTTSLTGVTPLDGGVLRGNTISWALPSVTVGDAGRTIVRFRARIAPGVTNRQAISNQARISGDRAPLALTDDPNTPENDDPTVFIVTAEARFDGMTKTVADLNGGQVEAGDRIRYTVAVTNEGSEVGRSVQVRDRLDARLVDVEPGQGGVIRGQEVVWNLGAVPAGQARTLSFDATIAGNTPDGTRIANQASLAAVGINNILSDDPATPAPDDATIIIVNALPELSVFTKTARDVNGGFLRPGDPIEFQIEVRNTGLGAAREIIVRDPVDTALLDALQPGQNGRVQAGVVTWDGASFPPLRSLAGGASVTLTLRASVRDEVPNGTTVLNQANLVAAGVPAQRSDDPSTRQEDDPTRLEVRFPEFASHIKSVRDTNGGRVEAGDEVRYTITVSAAQLGEPLTGVSVVDPVDANLMDFAPTQGGVYDNGTNSIRWNAQTTPALRTLSPGQEVTLGFTARISPATTPGTVISNQSTALAPADPDANVPSDDPANGLGDFNPTLIRVEAIPASDLSQTAKTVADENGGLVEAGDVLTYSIAIVNSGAGGTGSVTVLDAIPNLTSYVPGSLRVDGQSQDDGGQPTISSGIEVRGLNSGDTRVVSFQVKVDDNVAHRNIISNQALVTPELGSQALSDDPTTAVVDDPTQVVVGAGPNITGTTKTARIIDTNNNGRLDPSEVIEYEIRVPNRGTIVATGVTFTDTLNDGLRYQPGFFTVNGAALSEADDDDLGQVDESTITVRLGTIEPGQAPVIRFRARVLRGPLATNQGRITLRQHGPELTDADGNDLNGDQPTVTPVGVAGHLVTTKEVTDIGGGSIDGGDDLVYTITVTNDSVRTVEDIVVRDQLNEAFASGSVLAAPGGAAITGGDTITVRGFNLGAGETGVIVLGAKLQNGLEDGATVCNRVTTSADGLDATTTTPVCVNIGAVAGGAAVAGRVFEDVTERNGSYDEGDRVFAGFLVRAFSTGDLANAVSEVVSAEDGTYAFPTLPDGAYQVRWFANPVGGRPVEYGSVRALATANQKLQQDLLVDPSGRVYNSITGGVINGAELQLFYDESDPDPTSAGRLVPPENLPEGQQGQLTRDGFYRFDVEAGHIYRLEVVAPNQTLVFPSTRIEPIDRAWDPDQDPNLVVENEIPSLDAEKLDYFLRFDIRDQDSFVLNNHIPIDPLRSLIQLDKRVNKRQATVGEILSYTVSVTNGSSRNLLYNEATGLGGVLIRDAIPRGFSYVKGSGRVRNIKNGRATGSEVAVPSGELTLDFGFVPRDGDSDRPRPLDLGAGETIELVYQLVAGTDVKPGKEYTNRAILVSADGSSPISNEDTARVRIVYDPIFDQGLILGKVFCDNNADGWQDEGERGVYRAKVYLDNGWYATTDETGKFHIQAINPGNHLLKLDVNTLPAGAEPSTDIRRVFYVTRGLPVKVSFGTSCPENLVEDVDVNASNALLEENERRVREKFVALEGHVGSGTLSINGEAIAMPSAKLAIDREKVALQKGALDKPIVFTPSVPQGATVGRWALRITGEAEGDVVHSIVGDGDLPDTISWDGTASGAQALAGPLVYQAVLDVQLGAGALATSAPVRFGVAIPSDELAVESRINGKLFRPGSAEMTDLLKQKLTQTRRKVRGNRKFKWVVKVHTDDKGDAAKNKDLTGTQAATIKTHLAKELGIPAEDITSSGVGSEQPLVPNVGEQNRYLNRRVEITVTDPDPKLVEPKLGDAPLPSRGAWVNARTMDLDGEGAFTASLLKPSDGLVVVTFVNGEGMRSVRAVNVRDGFVALVTPELQLPEVPVSGDTTTGTLNVGKTTVTLPLLGVKATPKQEVFKLDRGQIKPVAEFNIAVPADLNVDSWNFTVIDGDGTVLHESTGAGAPPASVKWAGAVDEDRTFLIPAWYEAQLTVRTPGGEVGSAPVAQFRLEAPPEEPAKGRKRRRRKKPTAEEMEAEAAAKRKPVLDVKPQAWINGTQATLGPKGGFRTVVEGYTGQKILVEITTPTGARAIAHVEIPDGYPRPAGLEPGGATPILSGPMSTGTPGTGDPGAAPPEEGGEGAVTPEGTAEGETPTEGETPEGETPTEGEAPAEGEPAEDGEATEDPAKAPEGAAPEGRLVPADSPRFRILLAQDESTASDTPVKAGGDKAKADEKKPSKYGALDSFGGPGLDEALRDIDEVNVDEDALKSPAANLKVYLPPEGAELKNRELVVRGSTDPVNKITVNGLPVEVTDGEFVAVVKLPAGESEVVIQAEDPDGNKGVITWPVRVAEVGYFLMAFADTSIAAEGAELEGLNRHNSLSTDSGLVLHGETKVYLKGYMAGSAFLDNFFKEYKYTAYFDSARLPEFESFLTDTIQADRYYPIYGDSGETVSDVNARGKLYVLVEADQSKLIVGNTRAGLAGVEFFKYDRPFYGAKIDFNKTLAEDYKTELKFFVADDNQRVRHTWNYMSGTGGSLYWLRHGEILDGSEKVAIVVKDAASGIEVARIPQVRNVDYTIDNRTGRLLFKSPVPSQMQGGYLSGRVGSTAELLNGNPVVIEASYDYEADDANAELSWGGQLRETFADTFHIGGGYVKEGRGAGDGPDYTLWQIETGAKYTDRTKLEFEYAGSESLDAPSFLSGDGGLTYDPFSRREAKDQKGDAWLVRGQLELGDFLAEEGELPKEVLGLRSWFQTANPGFFSGGTILEQGQDKFGGEVKWVLDDSNVFRLRHDGMFTTVDDLQDPNPQATKLLERQVTSLQHTLKTGDWTLVSEYTHSFYDDDTVVDGYNTDLIAERLKYAWTDNFSTYIGQQVVLRGDPRIYNSQSDKLTSELGLEYRFAQEWTAEVGESIRWNGESATHLGLNTKIDENSTVYIKERFTTREDNAGVGATSIVGGESRFANGDGRLYSEYHVDSGLAGDQTRAVLGVGKRFHLGKGWTLDLGAERSQIKKREVTGDSSRSVVSGGWEYHGQKWLKLSQKLEVRYDDADPTVPQNNPCYTDTVYSNPDYCRNNLPGGADKLQFLTTNAMVLTFMEDHNLLTRFHLDSTENLTTGREEARHMEATFGYALRPVTWDWMTMLLKYTYLQDMRPIDLVDFREEREHSHVFTILPVFEVGAGFQLVNKFAFKRQFVRYDLLPEVESDTVLTIHRVNYHLTGTIDAGVEYRFLRNYLADDLKHGALVELNYILLEHARLGIGYNFTRFSDDELSDLDRDVGGFFFRVQGQY